MGIDLDEAKVTKNESGLWVAWVLATACGMLLGFLPARLIANTFGLGIAFIVVPLLAGAILGFLQWLALRRYVVESADWILNAGAGWAVGYAMGVLMIQVIAKQQAAGGFWQLLAGYAIFGMVIGLVQWPVLRREIPQLGFWILANIIGWTFGFTIASVVGLVMYSRFLPQPWIIALIVQVTSGLIAGAVTGLALVWIVRKPDIAVLSSADELHGTKGAYQAHDRHR